MQRVKENEQDQGQHCQRWTIVLTEQVELLPSIFVRERIPQCPLV
jgi:hypothetical protein